jgi:hypothetical protein
MVKPKLRQFIKGSTQTILISGELRYDPDEKLLDLYTEDPIVELLPEEVNALVEAFQEKIDILPQLTEDGFTNVVLTRRYEKFCWRKPYFDLGYNIVAPGRFDAGLLRGIVTTKGRVDNYQLLFIGNEKGAYTSPWRPEPWNMTRNSSGAGVESILESQKMHARMSLLDSLDLSWAEKQAHNEHSKMIGLGQVQHMATWSAPYDQPRGWYPGQPGSHPDRYIRGLSFFCPVAEATYEAVTAGSKQFTKVD